MKNVLALLVAAVMVAGGAAVAEDGQVAAKDLQTLGLSQLQVMSDADGLQVRGMSANSRAGGNSLVVVQLVDPSNPGSFAFASDVQAAFSSSEEGGGTATAVSGPNITAASAAVTLDYLIGGGPVNFNAAGAAGAAIVGGGTSFAAALSLP